MKLLSYKITEMSEYDQSATGSIYSLAIDLSDIELRVEEMHEVITDTSWLSPLDIIDHETYRARSKPTIEKIVNEILQNVESEISADFGEYMVSDSAQTVLAEEINHIRIPLAELIKEKISGNPGFDFHTETHDTLVAFGEAKYSGVANAHGKALKQINDFIIAEKDIQELSDIRRFVTDAAVKNAAHGRKAFCAAFSIVSDDVSGIMKNALESEHIAKLFCYEALYLVGVKVSA